MTLQQLGEVLNRMYTDAKNGEVVTMIHLFGIKYAKEITEAGFSKKDITKAAGINESYVTEINKGVNLSKYVVLK
jgi:5-methylcytosine-specific restriction protein B